MNNEKSGISILFKLMNDLRQPDGFKLICLFLVAFK